MPVDSYDRFFGSKNGSANKALAAMIKHYGATEGTRVFYAVLAERRKAKKTYHRAADGRG